jgi:hypothetical protein
VRGSRLQSRRSRRGYRRGDSALASLCTPWYAARALPGAVANAVVAVAGGSLVALVATLVTPPRGLVAVLAGAGVVMGALACVGPFSRRTRAGGAALTGTVFRSRTATLLATCLLLAAALALLATRQVSGAGYSPLPAPPWAHSLRTSLH